MSNNQNSLFSFDLGNLKSAKKVDSAINNEIIQRSLELGFQKINEKNNTNNICNTSYFGPRNLFNDNADNSKANTQIVDAKEASRYIKMNLNNEIFEKNRTPKKTSTKSDFDFDFVGAYIKSTPNKRKYTIATEGKSSKKYSSQKKSNRNRSIGSADSAKYKKSTRKLSEFKLVLDKRSVSQNFSYKIPSMNPRTILKNSPGRLGKKDVKPTVYQKWLVDDKFYMPKEQIASRKISDRQCNKREVKKDKVDNK